MAVYLGGNKVSLHGIEFKDPTDVLKNDILRPDATKVQTWKYDKRIVANEGVSLPTAYSTTDTTLLASSIVGTVNIDLNTYTYLLICRTLTIPEYSIDTLGAGREDYHFSSQYNEIISMDMANRFKSYADSNHWFNWKLNTFSAMTYCARLNYWNSADSINSYSTYSYGARVTHHSQSWDASNGTITVNSPDLKLRGHDTYLNQTYYEALTDIRYQWVLELYRAPIHNVDTDGWLLRENTIHISNDIVNNNWTLT